MDRKSVGMLGGTLDGLRRIVAVRVGAYGVRD